MRSFFGAKVVPPQQVMKALPKLFETKDGKARDKVKDVVVRGHWGHACTSRACISRIKGGVNFPAGFKFIPVPRPKAEFYAVCVCFTYH